MKKIFMMEGLPKSRSKYVNATEYKRKILDTNIERFQNKRNMTKEQREQALEDKRNVKAREKIQKALLLPNWRDIRKDDKRCVKCQKICVKRELHNGDPLPDTHTLCSYTLVKKRATVSWDENCVLCKRKMSLNKYHTEDGFTSNLVNALKLHVDGFSHDRRAILDNIRKRGNGLCSSCGIRLISLPQSGFAQESINMHSPELNAFGNRSISADYLVQSCLACNLFQNGYSWKQHLQNLVELCDVPLVYNMDISDIPYNWDDTIYLHCPINLRRKLLQTQGRYCAASGIEMRFESGYWNSVSVDKINGDDGYVDGNCRLVCKCINYVKNFSITEDQLQRWIAHVRYIGPELLEMFNNIALMHMPKE